MKYATFYPLVFAISCFPTLAAYPVYALRHVWSHVRVSTHVQDPRTSERSPVPTSLSTVQSRMSKRDFVVAITLVTVNNPDEDSWFFHKIISFSYRF